MRFRVSFLFVAAAAVMFATSSVWAGQVVQRPAVQTASSLQQAIDAADSGTIVKVPAGVHHEHLLLKDGVILMGEGAGASILDGDGYGAVVRGAKNAMIIGLTIRNGAVGIQTEGTFLGIFHNEIVDNRGIGIHINGGSAAIANNLIARNHGLGGVACNSAFPYLVNNTIIENDQHGIWAWWPTGPTLVNNIISGNQWGVRVGSGATAKTMTNDVWGNKVQDLDGFELSASDLSVAPDFQDVAKGDIRLERKSVLRLTGTMVPELNTQAMGIDFGAKLGLKDYQKLMNRVLDSVVQEQPVVRYELTDSMGLFNVHVKFPVATFSIRSSTPDTEIRDFDAWDKKTFEGLYSEYVYQDFPTIIVNNREYNDVEKDRYALDAVYYHPGSYNTTPKGQLVFDRETTFSRIEVEVPQGYVPVAVSEANPTFTVENGKVIVHLSDIGMTHIRMIMETISPMVVDVYGLMNHPELGY